MRDGNCSMVRGAEKFLFFRHIKYNARIQVSRAFDLNRRENMKKLIHWIIASALIMLAFPWLAVTFIKGDGGMAVCFILLFALNPIYVICAGVYAGKDKKRLWALPILTVLFFLAGTWLFFDMGEKAFFLYALVYLFLGITAMLVSMFIKKKH